MKKDSKNQLVIYNEAIQKLRDMISRKPNKAVKIILISLLNDQIYKKNRLVESIYDFEDQCWINRQRQLEIEIQNENKQYLKDFPSMMTLIVIRHLFSLDKLIQMACFIKPGPHEIKELEEYTEDIYL